MSSACRGGLGHHCPLPKELGEVEGNQFSPILFSFFAVLLTRRWLTRFLVGAA